MNDPSPFSSRLIFALAGSMLAAFALCLFLFASGAGQGGALDDAVGANSKSSSAIGHAGFYELLKRSGLPVSRAGIGAVDQVGADGVLVVAEPDLSHLTVDGFRLRRPPAMLVILPKWSGRPDRSHSGWIDRAAPLPPSAPQFIAGLLDGDADVVRVPAPTHWTDNRLGLVPTLDGEVQLIQSPKMTPLLGSMFGMLAGELDDDGRRIIVLADPDLIENHGIANGDNARFALALVGALRKGGPVLFDESVHGLYEPPANPLRLLFQFPAAIATIEVGIAIALLLAATMTRFGRPLGPPARLTFGKDSLIRNSAALLDHGGHHAVILRRYGHVVLNEAGRLLHAPPILNDQALAAWLDRVGTVRGTKLSAVEILARIDDRQGESLTELFNAARDMHRFKGELLNGS